MQSHFHVQPYNCVEVVLRCVVVGAVAIRRCFIFKKKKEEKVRSKRRKEKKGGMGKLGVKKARVRNWEKEDVHSTEARLGKA